MQTTKIHISVKIVAYPWAGISVQWLTTGWPNVLRRGSAADRLLKFRVQILPGAWIFVLQVQTKKQNAGKSRQRKKYEWSTENKRIKTKNTDGGEIFRTRPDRPWVSPSILYNGHRVSFPGVKQQRRDPTHPTPFSAEVNERVEIYLYSLHFPFFSGKPWIGFTWLSSVTADKRRDKT